MSNPNWPDNSQWYPGLPDQQQPQQPQQPQPANPTPYPADPYAPTVDSPFGPYGQPPAPYGQPAAPSPFAQPGASASPFGYQGSPSQALPGYSGTPSQGLPGYSGTPSQALYGGYQGTPSQALPGYAGPSSQQLPPYQGSPSQALYGQPSAPSMPMYSQPQWGPPSQTMPGGGIAPTPKRRLGKKALLLSLAIVVVLLLLVGGGAAYVVTSLGAPATAATQFCGDLKGQNYTAAYGMFSSSLRNTYSADLFTKGAQALDAVEGPVTQCDKATGSNAYSYSFGASTATLQAVLTRGKQGQLTGKILLKNEGGAWKVDSLDTSLLGVNLASLQTVNGFCQAVQGGDYATAYGLLGTTPQAAVSQSDFVTIAKLDDQYDGKVSACSLVALASGNTDSATSLTVSLTRGTQAAKTGTIALDVEGGAWKIATIDSTFLGKDYRPLLVAQAFCSDLQKGNYAGAYGLLSSNYQSGGTESDFASIFDLVTWTGCTFDLHSYKIQGTTASVNAGLGASSGGNTTTFNGTFSFVLEGGAWKIDDLVLQ